MKTYRRVHKTARVATFVVDGYRRCAFDGCRKVLPDEAHEARKYCNARCNNLAYQQRVAAR